MIRVSPFLAFELVGNINESSPKKKLRSQESPEWIEEPLREIICELLRLCLLYAFAMFKNEFCDLNKFWFIALAIFWVKVKLVLLVEGITIDFILKKVDLRICELYCSDFLFCNSSRRMPFNRSSAFFGFGRFSKAKFVISSYLCRLTINPNICILV